MPRARTPKIGCSADQVYSHGRQYADNWRPSCSCAAKFAGRMASNTATGALSRTRASAAGAWCSGTCCIWARSTTRKNWRGGGRSRLSRTAPGDPARCRCFPKTAAKGCWRTPRSSASFREGLRRAAWQRHLKSVQRISNRRVIADDRAKFDDPLLAEPRDRLGKGGVSEPFGIDQPQ